MSLKQLKSCLTNQMYRFTPIEEMPKVETPDFVQATLDAKNKQYAREAEREERRQQKRLKEQAAS